MKRFALSGNPISHSLSPLIFKAAYPGKDFTYELLETSTFDEAFTAFIREFDAINVTAPFKEDAFLCADKADEVTTLLKSANILKKENGSVTAFNSDYLGVKSLLQQKHISGRVLVIGCGGAGRSAALAANSLGLETSITNRTFSKAESFSNRISGLTPLRLEEAARLLDSFAAIIYTAPVPISILPAASFKDKVLIEANYRNPSYQDTTTGYISGLEWLCAQGICGFGLMTGEEPDGRLIKASAEKSNRI